VPKNQTWCITPPMRRVLLIAEFCSLEFELV
jgi:hypothetical protein